MRTQLTVILLLLTAFSAAAQFPVKTVNYYPASAPAEIHFVDGNVSTYPIMRITKDLIRVDPGNNNSIRMPLTYLESIRFGDGCTMFFDKGQFQFDKLVQPAVIKNEYGDAMLEGVLKLNSAQTEALMGSEAFREFRKNSLMVKIGAGSLAVGTMLCIPVFMTVVMPDALGGFNFVEQFGLAGGAFLVGGLIVTLIGNNGCKRVAATYNNGLGLAYTF